MKLIVAGSRSITDEKVLFRALDEYPNLRQPHTIVSGRARGADTLGEEWANCMGIHLKLFPADWNTHGRKAGPLRNIEMGNYADVLLALWDGESRGTQHMIAYMRSLNKPVYIYNNKETI